MRTNQAKDQRRRGPEPSPPHRVKLEARKPETKVRPVRPAASLASVTNFDSAQRSGAPIDSPPPADIHFGLLLRRARERRGLSIQDVARVTRISDKWLPALEEARLDHLPAPVFVTGYVRSYARVVGLDESDLVDRYHALNQQAGNSCPPARLWPQPPDLESSPGEFGESAVVIGEGAAPQAVGQPRWLLPAVLFSLALALTLFAVLRARGVV